MSADDHAGKSDNGTGQASVHFLKLVPHEFARRHLILSEGVATTDSQEVELLLVADSTKPLPVYNLQARLGRAVQTRLCEPEALARAIDRTYASLSSVEEGHQIAELGATQDDFDNAIATAADADILSTSDKAPLIRLVDLLLFEALTQDASDVHLQPFRDCGLVRYRVDGVLRSIRMLPRSVAAAVTSRIKIMAGLDVAEHRAAQDGRCSITLGGTDASTGRRRSIDLRVSVFPSVFGERVVMRILDSSRNAKLLSFEGLGMAPSLAQALRGQVARPNGVFLCTGPTGSGKTSTLYAALSCICNSSEGKVSGDASLRDPGVNIMTIEDPVEYELSSVAIHGGLVARPVPIAQTQVDPKRGVTFATGLRHILRQDPDVIMVGEIRDAETANLAIQASLTGHLVLSTLHTNDAPSAFARLIDLGIETYLLNASMNAILAQRLVRCTHQSCKGAGCSACFGTGYRGRTGFFELLVVGDAVRESVARRASVKDIREAACRAGMRSLREAGFDLVERGITTQRELDTLILPSDLSEHNHRAATS